MSIESLLSRYSHLRVERPPLLWESTTADERVIELLDRLVAAVQDAGAPLDTITLNVSNVVVEPPDDGEEMEIPKPGEYVGLTVISPTDLGPDATWHEAAKDSGLLATLNSTLRSANAHFAYVRRIPPQGSITIFLRRGS